MRILAISNIIFLIHIFIYQIFGDYDSVTWRNIFYIGLYGYLLINALMNQVFYFIKIHKMVNISMMIYFGFSFLTEVMCLIWPVLNGIIISATNLYLSGTLLIFIIFAYLTYKTVKQ